VSLEDLKNKYSVSDARPVLLTEVTRMSGGVYCVAAFDLHAAKMIRPLQAPGGNWRLTSRNVFAPCNVVAFQYSGGRGNGAYPHRTEDTVVLGQPRLLETLSQAEACDVLQGSLYNTIAELYENHLVDRKYVNDGTRCRSLGGVAVPIRHLRFDESFGKLRLEIQDNDGSAYSLGVTSDELQSSFQNNRADYPNLSGANKWLASFSAESVAILRLGLARAWDGKDQKYDPKRCFLQLNGIIIEAA
jgi:hypothetical protein